MNRLSRTLIATAALAAALGSAQAQTTGSTDAGTAAPSSTGYDTNRVSTPADGTTPGGTTYGGTNASGTGSSGTGMTDGERLHADRMTMREMRERRKPISQGELSVPGQDRGGYIGAGDYNSMQLYRSTVN